MRETQVAANYTRGHGHWACKQLRTTRVKVTEDRQEMHGNGDLHSEGGVMISVVGTGVLGGHRKWGGLELSTAGSHSPRPSCLVPASPDGPILYIAAQSTTIQNPTTAYDKNNGLFQGSTWYSHIPKTGRKGGSWRPQPVDPSEKVGTRGDGKCSYGNSLHRHMNEPIFLLVYDKSIGKWWIVH